MNKICPWCGTEKTHIHLWLKDEFLTLEEFEIFECQHCGLLFTEPRPNPQKISKYYKSDEYYSHHENKKGFIPKLYESVKKVNLRHKCKMATQGLKTGNVLDIGCGVGDFLHTMRQKGWDCVGVEPSEEAKKIAKKRLNSDILSPSAQETLPTAHFDLITMWHVLEHVDDLHWQLDQLWRLAKPGGRIIVALPNFRSYDASFYREKWAGYDVPRHLSHFNQETVVKMFKTKNLNHKKTEKLIWDAYYVSYLSEIYRNHRLPLIKGVYRGILSNLKARSSGEWSSLVYRFEKES